MKTLLAVFLVVSSSLLVSLQAQGNDPEDRLQPISQADFCNSQPCEAPQWKRQTCCKGYVCIQPEVYEPIQTPRCVNKESIPAIGSDWKDD